MENNDRLSRFESWACTVPAEMTVCPKDKKIWVCGIESGYTLDQSKEDPYASYYREKLRGEIDSGNAEPLGREFSKSDLRYQYEQKVAKLCAAVYGEEVGAYQEFADGERAKTIWRLNLYPISFNYADDALWNEYGLQETTGLISKQVYRTWCFLHRFPKIRELVMECRPRLIVGTGMWYLTDFMFAFGGASALASINQKTIQAGGESRTLYWSETAEGTIIAVTPFLNFRKNDLNSDALIEAFGEELKGLSGL